MALFMKKNILPLTVGLKNPLSPLGFVIGRKQELKINNAALAGIPFDGTHDYLLFGK